MAVTQKVTLYNNKFTVPPVINAVQNDTDRQVEAYFGDFTLQVGMTGKLSFIRSDGTHYEVTATLSTANNTATAELDQALTQAGVTQAQLKITDSGNVGSTFTFMIKVQPDVAGISVPQDGWSAQEFDQRLTDAENAIDAVEEDVEDLQDKEYDYAPVITDTASGAIATFPDGADSYPLKECVVNIEAVQSGSGDPSPDNIRPITGFSTAKITRTGKNLLNIPTGTRVQSGVTWETNGTSKVVTSGTATGTSYSPDIAPMVLPAGTYTVSFESDVSAMTYTITKDGAWFRTLTAGTTYTFTLTEPHTISGYVSCNSGTVADGNSYIQLELGSTATDYEPYNGQTVTIDLGSTRYGGVLDVTTGKMMVNVAYITKDNFDSVDNATSSGGLHWADYEITANNNADAFFMCSMLPTKPTSSQGWASTTPNVSVGVSGQRKFIRVYCTETNISDFKSTYSDLQIAYGLETPVEVDLTAEELETILGTNCIFASTGDVSVTYACDTRKFIEKMLA